MNAILVAVKSVLVVEGYRIDFPSMLMVMAVRYNRILISRISMYYQDIMVEVNADTVDIEAAVEVDQSSSFLIDLVDDLKAATVIDMLNFS